MLHSLQLTKLRIFMSISEQPLFPVFLLMYCAPKIIKCKPFIVIFVIPVLSPRSLDNHHLSLHFHKACPAPFHSIVPLDFDNGRPDLRKVSCWSHSLQIFFNHPLVPSDESRLSGMLGRCDFLLIIFCIKCMPHIGLYFFCIILAYFTPNLVINFPHKLLPEFNQLITFVGLFMGFDSSSNSISGCFNFTMIFLIFPPLNCSFYVFLQYFDGDQFFADEVFLTILYPVLLNHLHCIFFTNHLNISQI